MCSFLTILLEDISLKSHGEFLLLLLSDINIQLKGNMGSLPTSWQSLCLTKAKSPGLKHFG